MANVIWTPGAAKNLNDISDYIAADSVAMANHVVDRIARTVQKIRDMPNAGRIVPELARPDVRERFEFRYRIVYRLRDDRVTILAIWHGSRLLRPTDIEDL